MNGGFRYMISENALAAIIGRAQRQRWGEDFAQHDRAAEGAQRGATDQLRRRLGGLFLSAGFESRLEMAQVLLYPGRRTILLILDR